MTEGLGNGRLTERRLSELERDVGRLQERTEQIPVLTVEVARLKDEVKGLKDEVKSLRTTLITFSLGISGSAIAVLIGILVVSQQ